MKNIKFLALFAAVTLAGIAFPACSDSDSEEGGDIRVESVTLPDDLKDGIRIFVGTTFEVAGKVTVLPSNATNKQETYSSSDPEVVGVSDTGVITAKAEGNATITITVDGKSANLLVNVIEEDTYVAVTDVILPDDLKDGGELLAGQTLDLSGRVTIVPENATIRTETYGSSDTDVATVSDAGIVTAISEGTTDITVTVDGKSAGFVLTVTKSDEHKPVTGVEVNPSSATIALGETLDISGYVTVLPEEATNKAVLYSVLDEKFATVDSDGKVTGEAVGKATITVTSVDNAEATATIEVEVTFSGDYDRTGWRIADHFPELFTPTASNETNTTEFLFEDSNTDLNTFFALVKVGSSWDHSTPPIINNAENGGGWMHFTVDMGKPHTVNYFRFAYRSEPLRLKYMGIEKIYGSNDNNEFVEVTTGVTSIPGFDNGDPYISDNAQIPTSTYRYYKFWCQQMSGVCFSEPGGASRQVRKIWMGYDPALD